MKSPSDADIVSRITEQIPVGIWVARAPHGELVYANCTFTEIMGMSARGDVAVGQYAEPYGICTRTGELYPEDRMPFVLALRVRATVTVDDIVIHRHDGQKVHVRAQAKPVFDAEGTLTHVVIAFIDITREAVAEQARAESEARLRRAQRMESVGNLAGGIAHDFNNLLTTIKLIASGLRARELDPTKRRDLDVIDEVTDSAVHLTRSLLGFAGRGKHLAQRVSIHHVIATVMGLAQRTFDRRIELLLDLGAASGDIVGDLSQLEQVLMNLAVNARDAMPLGGAITFRTRDVALDDAEASRRRIKPGLHVLIEVVDSGAGIDPDIRDRIFEPYFTTKTSGATRGTGLGLATVHGIVESHQGSIDVEDRAPHGTAIRLYFPAAPEDAPVPSPAPSQLGLVPGEGTVLIVDDEPLVLAASSRAIQRLGYQVLRAGDGEEALAIFRERHAEIGAVLLDMVMPRMDGRATYLALRAVDPAVEVILASGYALNEGAQEILDLGVREFIAKPYEIQVMSQLLAKATEAHRARRG